MQGRKTSSGISMASLTPTADPFARPAGPGVMRPSLLLALLLAMILTAAWTARDFTALSMGRLPDNDDMMRLAQVQDWVGGQAWSDLSQHRLGPAGGARVLDASPNGPQDEQGRHRGDDLGRGLQPNREADRRHRPGMDPGPERGAHGHRIDQHQHQQDLQTVMVDPSRHEQPDGRKGQRSDDDGHGPG